MPLLKVFALTLILAIPGAFANSASAEFNSFQWVETNPSASWAARAGHQVLNVNGTFFLIAGRSPLDLPIPGASVIWGDVWYSTDRGASWTLLLPDAEEAGLWKNRAYFQAVEKAGYMYIIGGQNFIVEDNPCPPFPTTPPCPPLVANSDFFNDVWRSNDGINWEAMTLEAPWEGRAGLSAVALGNDLYVMAGSQNDDDAVVEGPAPRIYFNDVWKSSDDGATWTQMTAAAPWDKRAGGVTIVKDGAILMIGGEAGFVGPYFNDVWSSTNGATWVRLTADAGWSPRPGHKCGVVTGELVCFGGFGLVTNPMDMWSSVDGATWTDLQQVPWNAATPGDIKYDFDVVTVGAGPDAIYTFGGDRERFDLPPEVNVELVDDDVWRWSSPGVPPVVSPAVDIPATSEWALALLVLLLTGLAVPLLRYRLVR